MFKIYKLIRKVISVVQNMLTRVFKEWILLSTFRHDEIPTVI